VNRESIELRIDELNVQKKVLIRKALDLKKRIERTEGAIAEMWEWHKSWKDVGEYGYRSLEGGTRVLKVPQFKTQQEMQAALEGKETAIGGIDKKFVVRARENRARHDAQQAVDVLDGKSPYEEEDGDDNR